MDESAQHEVSPPRVFIETYGCQMNVADSELVGGVLRRAGYAAAPAPKTPTSSCSTPARSANMPRSACSAPERLARLKRARPELRLGLLGCMAQHHRARAGRAGAVARPRRRSGQLPPSAGTARPRALRPGQAQIDVRLDRGETYADIAPAHGAACARTSPRCADATGSAPFAWCRTCAAASAACRPRRFWPTSRGPVARGVREIVLLGQTVNAYRFGDIDFGRLLRLVAGSTESSESASLRPIPRT